MAIERRQIHADQNGDRWYLARRIEDGRVFIQHRAHDAPNNQMVALDVRDFLAAKTYGPEQHALVALMGELVRGMEVPDSPYE